MKSFVQISIALLVLTVATAQQECTVTCTNMVSYQCRVCYCSQTYSFWNCTHFYCPSRSCSVAQYQQRALQQNQCFSECCGEEMAFQRFTASSVQQCQTINQNAYLVPDIIFFTLIGGCFIVMVIVIFKKKCSSRNYNTESQLNQRNNIQSSSQLAHAPSLQWKAISNSQSTFNRDIICTVCLTEGSEVQTECQHNFHLNCIVDWLRVKNKCPNCMKVKINLVRYFCERCYRQYVTINVKNQQNLQSFRVEIYQNPCPQCT